jgi:hypothetical protein
MAGYLLKEEGNFVGSVPGSLALSLDLLKEECGLCCGIPSKSVLIIHSIHYGLKEKE